MGLGGEVLPRLDPGCLGKGFLARIGLALFGLETGVVAVSFDFDKMPKLGIESGILGTGGSLASREVPDPRGEGGRSLLTGDIVSPGSSAKPFAYMASNSSIPISSS